MGLTAADVVRRVFDYALDRVIARGKREVPAYVTREDLEQALIELKYAEMSVDVAILDMQQAEHERAMRDIQHDAVTAVEAGDVPQVEIVERDGTEKFHRVFPPRKDDE